MKKANESDMIADMGGQLDRLTVASAIEIAMKYRIK